MLFTHPVGGEMAIAMPEKRRPLSLFDGRRTHHADMVFTSGMFSGAELAAHAKENMYSLRRMCITHCFESLRIAPGRKVYY